MRQLLTVWLPRVGRGHGEVAARLSRSVATLAILQATLGVANVFLLAPVWLQMLHLLVADAVWIALVLFAATVLSRRSEAQASAHAA